MNLNEEIKNISKEEREDLYNKALINKELLKNNYSIVNNTSLTYRLKRLTELALANYYKTEGKILDGAKKYLYQSVVLFGSDEEFEKLLKVTNNKNDKIAEYTGINQNYVALRKLIYKLNQATNTSDNSSQIIRR